MRKGSNEKGAHFQPAALHPFRAAEHDLAVHFELKGNGVKNGAVQRKRRRNLGFARLNYFPDGRLADLRIGSADDERADGNEGRKADAADGNIGVADLYSGASFGLFYG